MRHFRQFKAVETSLKGRHYMRTKTKEELQQEVDRLRARDHKMTQVLELAMTGRLVFLGVVPSRGSGTGI